MAAVDERPGERVGGCPTGAAAHSLRPTLPVRVEYPRRPILIRMPSEPGRFRKRFTFLALPAKAGLNWPSCAAAPPSVGQDSGAPSGCGGLASLPRPTGKHQSEGDSDMKLLTKSDVERLARNGRNADAGATWLLA